MTRRYLFGASVCVAAGALICALLAAAISANLSAKPGDDVKARIDTQLAVQKALQAGLDQLQVGNYQAAVAALEQEIARIDGNRKYLDALATAYRGYVQELQKTDRVDELQTYRRRLEILDPAFRTARPAPPAATAPAATETPSAALPDKPTPVAALPDKPTPRPASNTTTNVARGKLDDPPPGGEEASAESKRKNVQEAATLVERATKEFLEKHYAEASRSYEQAHRLDSASTVACREQWAYAKVYTVSAALQSGPRSPVAAQDMEREVRQAMAMTTKIDDYAKTLLKAIQERTAATTAFGDKAADAPPLAMKHTPRQGQGWAMVETANFRILHNQPPDVAERAARIAEATRLAMSRKWFGDDGETWNPRCDIYLYATAEEYSQLTRTTAQSPGHSTMSIDSGRVVARRIDLHVDHAETFNSVLPHEATHVVLAGRFDGFPVPRWADEGMAVLTEPPNRIDRYLRNLPRHDQRGVLFGVGQLMRLSEYPDARSVDPFYTESVSLVDYLSKEKGPREFTAFLRDGLHDGYEPALRKHYHIENFADLERRWRAFAFPEPSASGESGR